LGNKFGTLAPEKATDAAFTGKEIWMAEARQNDIADMDVDTGAEYNQLTRDAAPWLSILIPVYNVAAYLDACLGSIVQQVGDDNRVEILLVDDCSTDGSNALAQAWQTRYPHLIRFRAHVDNRGISAVRNALLDEARGDYLWFIDSDDYILPGAVAELHTILAQHKPDLIIANYRRKNLPKPCFPGRGGVLESDTVRLISGIFRKRRFYLWQKIVRRAVWDTNLRFPEGRVFEDVTVVAKLLFHVKTYYYTRNTWVFYRTRPGSILAHATRTKHSFDTRSSRDLADCLTGYKEQVVAELGTMPSAIAHPMASFLGWQFAKLTARYHRAIQADGNASLPPLSEFRKLMENASPMTLPETLRHFRRSGQWINYALLRRAMRLVKTYL
jgi:Glycosyl transferase family 2